MRLAVFVFSLVLIFVPTYAHALFWLGAAKGMVVRTAAGQFIKVGSKKAFAGAMLMAGATGFEIAKKYCIKTKKCGEFLDEADDFLGLDDDDNVSCDARPYYRASNYKGYNLERAVQALIDEFMASRSNYTYISQDTSAIKDYVNSTVKQEINDNLDSYKQNANIFKAVRNAKVDFEIQHSNGNISKSYTTLGVAIDIKVNCDSSEELTEYKEQQKQEQLQKIVNNLSDDDVTYIINNYGDDIEIQKYCAESGSCDELSKEFGNEVTKNKGKYDIDKINKANCEVKNGKIVSCEGAKVQLELDFESEEEQETEETQEGKEEETVCDTSDITREICEYLDWVDDEAEEPTDTKVEIEEPSDEGLDEEMINIMKSCPADIRFDVTMLGHSMNLKMSTMPFCLVAENIRPYIIGAGTLSALFILAGIRR